MFCDKIRTQKGEKSMLAAAVLEHLLKNDVREVELDLFETDQNIIPLF